MASIIKADNGAVSGISGITQTADNSGTLELQATSGIVSAQNVTGALVLPKGTTAQRPASPIAGSVRWNTTFSSYELYDGTAWKLVSVGGYSYSASYLMIAGGGGGGTTGGYAGGAGAGGLLTGTQSLTQGTTYSFVIGGGGSVGVQGSNTTGFSLTCIGGGNGGNSAGNVYAVGGNGGCGGGAAASGNSEETRSGGTGTSGQGYRGGNCAYAAGGGGGGTSAQGTDTGRLSSPPGNGGAGTASSITGSSVTYGGGGGAGYPTPGTGGAGGGGDYGVAGSANTGGGGGGGIGGGSGVVILSVPTSFYSGVTTGSPTVTTSGSNTILKFTSSGSYTA